MQMLDIFLTTPFDGGRHTHRVEKIETGSGDQGPGTGAATQPTAKE
jgi:hypothetical protein